MNPLSKLLSLELHTQVTRLQRVSGGDTCQCFRADLDNGQSVFVKTRPHCPPEMFPCEARGLAWLQETQTLRIPQVLAVTENYLALEFLSSGRPDFAFEEKLGQGLALLHRFPTSKPGLDYDNFIGPLPQPNRTCQSWSEFYIERRLRPRLKEAVQKGVAPGNWPGLFEKLFGRLHTLIPKEPLSRLHGDLWGGNLHTGPNGEPCLIDPAVYVGHREVDLAMMKLFGGFSPRVFQAYEATWPLAEEYQARIPLYQLYPLLVHVVLFGASYVPSVKRALKSLN